VDWARRGQFTAKKVERIDPEHSGMKFGITFEKFSKGATGDIAAARERNVWVPGT
jgi:hypothetical protein